MSSSSTPSERALRIHRAATAYADHHHSDPWAYGIISIQMHDGLIDPDDVLVAHPMIGSRRAMR
jgi:hypothetical protein